MMSLNNPVMIFLVAVVVLFGTNHIHVVYCSDIINNHHDENNNHFVQSYPSINRNQYTTTNAPVIPWYEDFMTLPNHVPWPGSLWLDRIAKTNVATETTINDVSDVSNHHEKTNHINQTLLSHNISATQSSSTTFIYDGISYTSIYAAILHNDPIQYPCRNFNAYLNSIFISPDIAVWIHQFTSSLLSSSSSSIEMTHYILCYIRNFIGAMIVYYGTASIFHYFCYIHPISKMTFQSRIRPSTSTIYQQILLAQCSLFIYVLLPVIDEYAVEQHWTQTYYTIFEIGGYINYILYLVLYFTLVEIGIYWMHRTLHTNKILYKYIHMKHHQYNKPETLTPWASIAFHPLDGILQASPYFVVIFFVPCHYLTHVILLFFTAIWATYIHDAMDWNIDPIMGSKYHTVHHTHYIYNYGQVFTFCDRFWGTLRTPIEPTGTTKQKFLKYD